jgi:hypothetical protein
MYKPIQLTVTIPAVRTSLSRSPLQRGFLLSALVLTCFALSPTARAADGGLRHENTAEGDGALFSLTSGSDNTAIGFNALFSNTTGNENTATGVDALASNTTGNFNTAIGFDALFDNTTGDNNTANGANALFSNTTGGLNTASGVEALHSNTGGNQNTANGFQALFDNTIGTANTADGVQALFSNTEGTSNTANGFSALFHNATGSDNTANGDTALGLNTTGNNNTADGFSALSNNTNGSSNIALGFQAGANLTTGSNNIDIGNAGVAGESGIIRIGTTGTQTATFLAAVGGVAIAGGMPVRVSASGQLGVKASSARFKEAIKPMDKASEAIFSLQPVTFRYKKALDPEALPQFGLVAEQVAKVDPDLVARDVDGKPYTVRYEEVNAMLLNEFLKEHRKVEEQTATIAQQRKDFESKIAQQQKQITALIVTVQKVSDQLQLSQAAPQLVANTQ